MEKSKQTKIDIILTRVLHKEEQLEIITINPQKNNHFQL